jgi:predicted branched-subunit amino acid permease
VRARYHAAAVAHEPLDPSPRRAIHRQAASIALALAPFGVAFGIACRRAGLSTAQAMGFSSLVFTGGTQFAAVSTLATGGGVAAAVTAGVLLALRSLAFGIAMAPDLAGPWWRRALEAHLMIDESTAVGSAQHERRWRRYGYLCAGGGVFVVWNATTFLGSVAFSDTGSLVRDLGIDATIPAAFLALVWPRLVDTNARIVALVGAAIAFGLVPVAPAGVPIIAAAVAVLLDGRIVVRS